MVRLTGNEGMRPGLLDLLNTYADEQAEEAHRASQGFGHLMSAMPELLNGQPAVLRTVPLRMTQQENMFSEDWEF